MIVCVAVMYGGKANAIMFSVGAAAVSSNDFNIGLSHQIKFNSPTPLLSVALNNQSQYEITPTSPSYTSC